MFLPKVHLVALSLFVTAWPLVAQVSEEEAPVDLGRGLALKADTAKPDVPLAEAAQTQVGAKDFSLAMTAPMPEPLRETVLAAQIDDSQGWRLLVTADGALRLEARVKGKVDPFAVATTPGAVTAGSAHHVAVNIVRDAAKPNAGIWLDGIELASGIVPSADLTTLHPLTVANGAKKIHLYQRGLSRPELLALWLDAAGNGKPAAKHPPIANPAWGFVPQQDETIALIGGTDAVAFAESGEIEALLLLAHPETRFHLRCLAWEGDTVFRQDRPMNFGDLGQQLQRVNAGAVFVMFGRQECLDRGHEGLPEFKSAFTRLLDVVENQTPNIVVVAPLGFEYSTVTSTLKASLREKSQELLSYNHAIAEVCAERNLQVLDLSDANFDPKQPMTRDGVNWTPYGLHLLTQCLGDMLGISFPDQAQFKDKLPAVRTKIEAKNRLWHDYWRPSNWAFLHGDRTQQPSSRDPVNPQLRFFPAEQEKYLPLIKEAEDKVYKLVEEQTKKLP